MRELEKAQIKFQSKYPTVGRDGVTPLNGAPSSSSITAAPMGFQSKDQVMQVFEYLMAHQADKQDQAEVAKVAAASARATRKSASGDMKNKRNSTGTRPANKASSKSNKKEWNSNSRSTNSDKVNASATSYGPMGIFIALCTGGFLLWGITNKDNSYRNSNSNSKCRGEKTVAHFHRISKHFTVPNKYEEMENNDDNFLWDVLIFLIGENYSMKLPTRVKNVCAGVSLFCRILQRKIIANFRNFVCVAILIHQWISRLINRAYQEIESQKQKRAARSSAQHGSLTSWTTSVSISHTNAQKKKVRNDIPKEASAMSLTNREVPSKSLIKNKNMSPESTKISKKKTKATVLKKSVHVATTVITSMNDVVIGSPSEIELTPMIVICNEADNICSEKVEDDFNQLKDDDSSINSLERPRISTSSPTLSVMTMTTTPSSPSSVAALDEAQNGMLSDAQVFDDSYWRSVDNEAEEESEGAWIETVTLPSKGKLRKTQNDERMSQSAQPLSKQRQEVFKQQLVRKSAEAAFSSISMSGRDRHSNVALQQARKGVSSLRRKSPIHIPSTTLSLSSTSPSSIPHTSSATLLCTTKEISLTATTTLKTMVGINNTTRNHHPRVPEHLTVTVELPQLPIYGSIQSANSSAENSTDAEDQSSISGDSHLSSPRSRSFSCGHETVNTADEPMADPMMHQSLQQELMGHHMQMQYYPPMGFMPMTMQQTVYDPSMNLSFSPPTGILSSEQQQGLLQHQQAIMMMPYPPIYMLPHPQFDHMQHQQHQSPIHGSHLMNIPPEEQIEYNNHVKQIYYESQAIPNNMSMSVSIMEEPILNSNDIVDLVRQQM